MIIFKKSILNEKELHQRGQALQKFNLKGVYILASATFVVTFFLMGDSSTSNAVSHLSKKHSIEGKVKLVCRPGLPTILGFHDFNLIILD